MTAAVRRAGVDTGGTFTDAVARAGAGEWRICKVPTTPGAPEQAVLEALGRLWPPGTSAPLELVHGTTHATNALLTGRVGRVVLVTTRGFADLLAIGRQERDVLYALEPRAARPRQPRRRVVEVGERLDAAGRVVQRLDAREVERVVGRVSALRPQAVAVALLHAWRAPRHERRLGRALRRLRVPVFLSSEVAPEIREYERAVTTWADAALHPVVAPACASLERALVRVWGSGSSLRMMRSDGGTAAGTAAAAAPARLALSGPAGGLSAARTLADARGDGAVLTLDMGGTSTDVALLEPGELPLQPLRLGGLPLLTRGLPVHSVGTGGGSLAALDLGGALRVGPDSAGAEPGPACYGRGGEQATVTDAHLVCGRLLPEEFLGGGFALDPGAAEQALGRLGRRLGLAAGDAAAAVLEVATAGMERALRRVSLAEGRDPRELWLYAFGGAAGLHACWLAQRLGMRGVVLPPHPGVFSALGLLSAPARRTLAASVVEPLPPAARRRHLFEPLLEAARDELVAEGVTARRIRLRRTCELRGAGQAGVFALAEGPRLLERFHDAHARRFGYARRDAPVELVTVRVQADGPAFAPWRRRPEHRVRPRACGRTRLRLPEAALAADAPVHRREELAAGAVLTGPALIVEYSATTVLPPGWRARQDGWGCLSITRP